MLTSIGSCIGDVSEHVYSGLQQHLGEQNELCDPVSMNQFLMYLLR